MNGFFGVVVRPSVFHKFEDHDFHMSRFGRCPYCDAGSKPVCKETILEYLNRR